MQPLWRAEERRRGRGHAGGSWRPHANSHTRDCEGPPCTRALRIPLQLYLTHRGLRTRGVWHDVVDSLLKNT